MNRDFFGGSNGKFWRLTTSEQILMSFVSYIKTRVFPCFKISVEDLCKSVFLHRHIWRMNFFFPANQMRRRLCLLACVAAVITHTHGSHADSFRVRKLAQTWLPMMLTPAVSFAFTFLPFAPFLHVSNLIFSLKYLFKYLFLFCQTSRKLKLSRTNAIRKIAQGFFCVCEWRAGIFLWHVSCTRLTHLGKELLQYKAH